MPRVDPALVARYAPTVPLPPYRHLPGVTPHPLRDPQGHHYGRAPRPDGPPLDDSNWRTCTLYLAGLDLYNHGYWWEAHEWWEGLWRQPGATPASQLFLQALIQMAVALVKKRQGSPRGVNLLLGHAQEKLGRLAQSGCHAYAGLSLAALQVAIDQTAAPVDPGATPLPLGPVLRLEL
jgi:hypothetical protein